MCVATEIIFEDAGGKFFFFTPFSLIPVSYSCMSSVLISNVNKNSG